MLPIAQHRRAVDEDVLHPHRILVRFLKSSAVGDGLGIEHHHIGEVIRLQPAAVM